MENLELSRRIKNYSSVDGMCTFHTAGAVVMVPDAIKILLNVYSNRANVKISIEL